MCRDCRTNWTISDLGSGYLTLFPFRELGSNRANAFIKSRVDPVQFRAASGYAVYSGGKSRYVGADIQAARRLALSECGDGAVLICQAVATGADDRIVFEHVETIRKSDDPAWSSVVMPGGTLLTKARNPQNKKEFDLIISQLAGGLARDYHQIGKEILSRHLDALDVDWGKMTLAQQDKVFDRARQIMANANLKPAVEPWKEKVELKAGVVMRGVRANVRANWLPQIGATFSLPDREAAKAIGEQQGWWLRDANGRIANNVTNRGRDIVRAGLEDGLGRAEIAKDLVEKIPGIWRRKTTAYAELAAAVAVSRARSWSEVSSYKEANIEKLEIQAVLDEVTSDICRFLDGQIITVDACAGLLRSGFNVKNPTDIKKTNPFISVRGRGKNKFLSTFTGTRLAGIKRSGVGNRDDRGKFSANLFGQQLVSANIGPPPYHYFCRSWTVPVTSQFQVPAGYDVRAVNQDPVEPRSPQKKPQGPLSALMSKPKVIRQKPTDRPQKLVRKPISGRPAIITEDVEQYESQRLQSGIQLEQQINARVQSAIDEISRKISAKQKLTGKPLSDTSIGKEIRGHIEQLTGDKKRGSRMLKEIGMKNVDEKYTKDLERVLSDARKSPNLKLKPLSERDASVFYNEALEFVDDSIIRHMGKGGLPRVMLATGLEGKESAFHIGGENVIIIKAGTRHLQHAKHEMSHALDEVGSNNKAAIAQRDRLKTGKHAVLDGKKYVNGKWADKYSGIVYDNNDGNEFVSVAHGALAPGKDATLGQFWRQGPEQIGFLVSYLRGNYVP